MKTWRLILDPSRDGQTNMAVDAALLKDVAGSAEPQTVLRFYSWTRPTVSLGRNQTMERAVDLKFCCDRGIDIVHRPTGGRAVLHDDELTYSITSNDLDQFDCGSVYGTYRRISEALALGYRSLGLEASLAPATPGLTRRRNGPDVPCFVSPSRYELMFRGRKIVGSAQRRLRRAFLQHGSMPRTCDRSLLAGATRVADAGVLRSEMAALGECLIQTPSLEDMVSRFRDAFAEVFGVRFVKSESPGSIPEVPLR